MDAGLRVDVCGPLRMADHMVSRDQGLPTAAANPEDARNWGSGVAGC